MFSSIARTRVSAQTLAPVLRRNMGTYHTTAQFGKAKGLTAPLTFLVGSAVFTYALMWVALPVQEKKQTA